VLGWRSQRKTHFTRYHRAGFKPFPQSAETPFNIVPYEARLSRSSLKEGSRGVEPCWLALTVFSLY